MPTKPKTSKGRKSQNDKLCKWVEKEYPDYIEYEILPLNDFIDCGDLRHHSSLHLHQKLPQRIMNYTLKQLQERVNQLIENQGENAQCAADLHQGRLSFEG